MRSFTNRALGVGGDANTTSVTVRLPDEVVAFIDSHFTGRIKNRSEFLQHWAQVGVRVSEDEELDEALDWALDRTVQPKPEWDWKSVYGPVTIDGTALEMVGDHEAAVAAVFYDPPEPTVEDLETSVTVPEGAVIHIKPDGSGEILIPDELTSLRESQLEALRSRVK